MKLLAARHPCNHLLVQELAIRAALAATLTASPTNGPVDRHGNNLYQAAEQVAQSTMSMEEALTYGPQQQRVRGAVLGPIPLAIVQRRLAMRLCRAPITLPGDPAPSRRAPVRRLLATAPGRFVALYGPHTPLPPLPAHLHDAITYDEAAHHVGLMQRLLGPLGMQVSMSGATRRGCPLGLEAELILALTPEANAELAGIKQSIAEERAERLAQQEVEEAEWRRERRRQQRRLRRHRDPPAAATEEGPETTVQPSEATPASLVSRHADRFAVTVPTVPPETLRGLRTVPCAHAEVVAVADAVPAKVAHRHRRAMQTLRNSGYLVTNLEPLLKPATGESGRRRPLRGTVRYDPSCPTAPPPFHATAAHVLQRIRLHRLSLEIVPTDVFLIRRFFHTGPAAFTAHVTLHALEKGFELNLNGLFLRTDSDDGSGAKVHHRVLLHSEMEMFSVIGMPYVDPLCRSIYCQRNNITMNSR